MNVNERLNETVEDNDVSFKLSFNNLRHTASFMNPTERGSERQADELRGKVLKGTNN